MFKKPILCCLMLILIIVGCSKNLNEESSRKIIIDVTNKVYEKASTNKDLQVINVDVGPFISITDNLINVDLKVESSLYGVSTNSQYKIYIEKSTQGDWYIGDVRSTYWNGNVSDGSSSSKWRFYLNENRVKLE